MGPVSPASTRRDTQNEGDGEHLHSPASTLVSPVSQHQNPQHPTQHRSPLSQDPDDNLPEVYVDPSPQAIWNQPAAARKGSVYEHDEKYALENDNDTLKLAVHPDPRDLGAEEAPGDFPPGAMAAIERNPPPTQPAQNDRILGLRRRTFFIVLAIVLIVVAAAVGGGVGGAVAASSNSDSDNAAAATSTAASSTASEAATATASDAPSSTSGASKPTLTDLSSQTEPEDTFSFQAYGKPNFKGNASEVIIEEGGTDLGFDAISYIWKPNHKGCCVSFCNSEDDFNPDFYCDERYRSKSSGPFSRVFIWCGEKRDKANSRCSEAAG